jgi:hypothetical protein
LNVNEVGVAVSVVAAVVTFKVTLTVCDVAPLAATVMVAVCEPDDRPDGLTETEAVPGVVPLAGFTATQDWLGVKV